MTFIKKLGMYLAIALGSYLITYTAMHYLKAQPEKQTSERQITDKTYWHVENGKVTVYTAKWCSACNALKAYLKANNIPYTNFDIEDSELANNKLKEHDIRQIPVILINEKMLLGFNQLKLEAELKNL